VLATVAAVALLIAAVSSPPTGPDVGTAVAATARAVTTDPVLLLAIAAYALAFYLRTFAWCRVLPGLRPAHSWAALHVSLLGNHVLPLRLGEPLRVLSVLRRTDLPAAPVIASAVSLRAADLLSVVLLAAIGAPAVLVASAEGSQVIVAVVVAALVAVAAAGVLATVKLRRTGAAVSVPGPVALSATVLAWVLETAVVAAVASAAGASISFTGAIAVTAVTVAAQAVAVTPGGFGTYEAVATTALVALGVPVGTAFAIALVTHAVKTAYAVLVGLVALALPAPAIWGRLRLPRQLPTRPEPWAVAAGAPVVAMVPVHDEAATVAAVVERLPHVVRPLASTPSCLSWWTTARPTGRQTWRRQPAQRSCVTPATWAWGQPSGAGWLRPAPCGLLRWCTWTPTSSTTRPSCQASSRRCSPARRTTWWAHGSPGGSTPCSRSGGSATGC
jgi:uncharacterized membrane protein YbhN (UPF0104 family)